MAVSVALFAFSCWLSLCQADRFYIGAQYASPTCDPSAVTLFESIPQSSCAFNGATYTFWNCSTGTGNPELFNCGSDKTCSAGCSRNSAGGSQINASLCSPYVGNIYSKRFCSDVLVPASFAFDGATVLSRFYSSSAGCANKTGFLSLVGMPGRCGKATATAGARNSCKINTDGTVALTNEVCPTSTTCETSCSVLVTTKGNVCAFDATRTAYSTNACSFNGSESESSASAQTTAGSSSSSAQTTTAASSSSVATASSGVMTASSGMVGQTSAGGAEAALHKFALFLVIVLSSN